MTDVAKKDPPKPVNKTPGPDEPKLYNTIIIFDVYTVAKSSEKARETLLHWIQNEQFKPSESVAHEVRRDPEVRLSWREEKPLVADDITDEEFEKTVKGHTTIQIFEQLYLKR